jgi:hypothetical protein
VLLCLAPADILARKIANDNSTDRGVGSPYCKWVHTLAPETRCLPSPLS